MAADLALTPATGIHVQPCGDAHLLNFGGFATPERRLIFDINDLDETLPAPWEWDLKRLVASFQGFEGKAKNNRRFLVARETKHNSGNVVLRFRGQAHQSGKSKPPSRAV
jgi:Uncharacterized protein conserved in bacteria (DUF2252)